MSRTPLTLQGTGRDRENISSYGGGLGGGGYASSMGGGTPAPSPKPPAANARVVLRFRPLSHAELNGANGGRTVIQSLDNKSVVVQGGEREPHPFTFDGVFPTNSSQVGVYDNIGRPIVQAFTQGYNGCLLAYGQTGSGKTHTMMGPDELLEILATGGAEDLSEEESRELEESAGIVPRVVQDLFHIIESERPPPGQRPAEYQLEASCVEIYREQVKDLLDPRPEKCDLKIINGAGGAPEVKGLTHRQVQSSQDLIAIMQVGMSARRVASTAMNERSSRSHFIFMLKLSREDPNAGTHTQSVLYLCDLAGSEMVGKTNVTGEQLREAGSINTSLTTLGLVINKLTDKTSTHIPYRDSRLTRLLENALGGNSNTALLITCSPSPDNFSETLSTLRFGMRAKTIQQTAKVNVERSMEEMKRHCERLERELGGCARLLGEFRGYATAGAIGNTRRARGQDLVGALVHKSLGLAPPDAASGGDPKFMAASSSPLSARSATATASAAAVSSGGAGSSGGSGGSGSSGSSKDHNPSGGGGDEDVGVGVDGGGGEEEDVRGGEEELEEEEEEDDEEEEDEDEEDDEAQKRMEMMLLRLKSSLQAEKASKEALVAKDVEIEDLQQRLRAAAAEGGRGGTSASSDEVSILHQQLEDRDIYIRTLQAQLEEKMATLAAVSPPTGGHNMRSRLLGGGGVVGGGGGGTPGGDAAMSPTKTVASFMGDSPQDLDLEAPGSGIKATSPGGGGAGGAGAGGKSKKTFLGSLLTGIKGIKERILNTPRTPTSGEAGSLEGGGGVGGSPTSSATASAMAAAASAASGIVMDGPKIDAYKARALAFFGACESGVMGEVESLLAAASAEGLKGALIGAQDRSGRTAALYAARGGALEVLHLLAKEGADLGCRDKDARSALAYAARRGHVEVGSWLLACGLRADQSDVHGLTPLHQSVLAKSGAMTELLLNSGADVTAQDSNGLTPYKLAKRFLSMDSPESRDVLLSMQEFIRALPEATRTAAGWTESRIGSAQQQQLLAAQALAAQQAAAAAAAAGGGAAGGQQAPTPTPTSSTTPASSLGSEVGVGFTSGSSSSRGGAAGGSSSGSQPNLAAAAAPPSLSARSGSGGGGGGDPAAPTRGDKPKISLAFSSPAQGSSSKNNNNKQSSETIEL